MILFDYVRDYFVPGAENVSTAGRHRASDTGSDFDPTLAGVLSICFFTGLLLGSRFRQE